MKTSWTVLFLLCPLVCVTEAQRGAFREGNSGFQGALPTGSGCRDAGEEGGGVRCCNSDNTGRCYRDDFNRYRCCIFYDVLQQCCNDLQLQPGSGPRRCQAMGGNDPFAAMNGQGQGKLRMQGQGMSRMQNQGFSGTRGQGSRRGDNGEQRGNRGGGGRHEGEGQRGGYRGWGRGHQGGRGQGQGGRPGVPPPVPGVTGPILVTDPSVTAPSLTLPDLSSGQLPALPK